MASGPAEPERPRPRRRHGTFTVLATVAGIGALIDAVFILSGPRPTRPPAQPSPSAAVARTAAPSSTPAENTPPAPAANPTAVPPTPGPRMLPASNAFTTLEDYRQRRAAMPHPPEPLTPPPAGRTPETELGRVTLFVRDYRAAYGSNPVGTNKEITRVLLGDNPRGTKFLDPSTVVLNAQGELLDAWNHPYFFHALSGTLMEIRSAGPDGKIFTPDDLVR